MTKKYVLILLVEIVACISFAVLAIWQFSEIITKQSRLNSSNQMLDQINQEIESAEEILDQVSTDEFHDLFARKKHYGVEGEREFVAK